MTLKDERGDVWADNALRIISEGSSLVIDGIAWRLIDADNGTAWLTPCPSKERS